MPRPLIEPAIVSKSDQLSALEAVANVGAPFGKGEHPDVAKRHIVPVGLGICSNPPGLPPVRALRSGRDANLLRLIP